MLTELVMTFALASEEPTARVKAVLALSAAALKLQKQSTPPPLFFERLEFTRKGYRLPREGDQ